MGKSIIIIPARMDSQRLPGKPLLETGGKALVEWTYLMAKRTASDYVIVTAEDREIGRYCREHRIAFMPTSEQPRNGTERCAELYLSMAAKAAELDVIVNWQCDEPCIPTDDINRLIDITRLRKAIYTIAAPGICPCCVENPARVKVVIDQHGECHWFSRAPMAGACGHVGVYAFDPDTLLRAAQAGPTPLGEAESLEQLPWLEHHLPMRAMMVEDLYPPLSINTPEDWQQFCEAVSAESN